MHLTEERVKRVQREADLNKIYSEALNSFENSLPDELANMIDNVKIVNDRIEIIAKPSKEDKIIDSLIVLVREIKNLKLVIGSEEGMYSGINYGGFNVEVIKSIIPKENDGQKPLRVGQIAIDKYFTIVITQEDCGRFSGQIKEFPSAISYGENKDTAYVNTILALNEVLNYQRSSFENTLDNSEEIKIEWSRI